MKKLSSISLLYILTLFSPQSKSQSITLGTGTAVNATNASSPVNIWFRRCVSQTVYTVAELNAAGINGPATIRQLGYYITQAPIYAIPDYQISIKHTGVPNANPNLEGGYTVVKNGFTYQPTAGGWDMINLDNPFVWNGTQNLVVRICWSQVSPNYDASGQCRIYNTTNGYKYRWDDNAGNACGLVPNTTNTNKPQIHFIFDTVTVWTGAVSNVWTNPSNWSRGVPNTYMDARIPTGTPNNPLIISAVSCDELILEGNLTLASSGTLSINKNIWNTGSFIDNGGITKIIGKGTGVISGTTVFENLHIENQLGVSVVAGITTIGRELQVNKSTFSTNNSVVLRSDQNGTARIAELKATLTYTLQMLDSYGDGWNGGFITVLENGVPIGTYSALGYGTTTTFNVLEGSIITLNYTAGTWENENSVILYNPNSVTIFTDNAPIATGNIFTTTASGNFTNMIIGNISMERYIDAGETYWRYFASAVQGATIANYLDDFVTAGFPGSPWPDFPFNSIYTYDETLGPGLGYIPCSGASQIIQVGQGLQVWAGDTITGTQPFVIDLVGQPNQGPITMPVTYTFTGIVEEDGWNLVGNPYASTIDWDSPRWTKVNMANAIYIQDPDTKQYATYVAGASTNGGSRYIASQQSFWVHAIAPSPQLIATEGIKSSIDQTFIKAHAETNAGTKIRLQSIEKFDEVVIRDIPGTTEFVEYEFDAKKLWGGWGSVPQLSFVNSIYDDLTVHSFDFENEEWTIPLRAIVFETGIYHLIFENTDELNVTCLKIEDTYTGNIYAINNNEILSFEMYDTTYSPRFLLHIGKKYPQLINNVTCYGENNGSIEIDFNQTGNANYSLTSLSGVTYGNSSLNPLLISDLSSSIYTLEIPDLNNICDIKSIPFVINQPAPIITNETIQNEISGNDGSISLTITGGTMPYLFFWNGIASLSTITDLQAGEYEVIILDANNCHWQGNFIVGSSVLSDGSEIATNFLLFYATDIHTVFINGIYLDQAKPVQLFNANGQLIQTFELQAGISTHQILIQEGIASGVYFLKSTDQKINFRFYKP